MGRHLSTQRWAGGSCRNLCRDPRRVHPLAYSVGGSRWPEAAGDGQAGRRRGARREEEASSLLRSSRSLHSSQRPRRLSKKILRTKTRIKLSVRKKVEEEREEPKPEKLVPRLKSTMSTKNLFSEKHLFRQISEFYHELKRIAVGSKTPVEEEAKKEVNNVAESPQQDSKLLIPNKLKSVIEKSTFPKDVRANPPTPQCFPYPRGIKNAKAIANGRSPLNSKPMSDCTLSKISRTTVLQEGCSNVSVVGDFGGTTIDLFWFLKPCSYLE
ncbi:hypothetical protein ZIOFF_035874 [Zingiber officinale]|uniref:Uncharacterized protein n=1 Tax=Zingiber officinale TaxID=94328 RepID=A0A8J5KY27_ZINOF|nr:hypothetical protein ZIOFF_035874 [Zingiber officinale]